MSEPLLPISIVGVAEGVPAGIICCCCALLWSLFKCCPIPGCGVGSMPLPPWLEAMLDLLDESADIGSHGEFIIALVETLEPWKRYNVYKIGIMKAVRVFFLTYLRHNWDITTPPAVHHWLFWSHASIAFSTVGPITASSGCIVCTQRHWSLSHWHPAMWVGSDSCRSIITRRASNAHLFNASIDLSKTCALHHLHLIWQTLRQSVVSVGG